MLLWVFFAVGGMLLRLGLVLWFGCGFCWFGRWRVVVVVGWVCGFHVGVLVQRFARRLPGDFLVLRFGLMWLVGRGWFWGGVCLRWFPEFLHPVLTCVFHCDDCVSCLRIAIFCGVVWHRFLAGFEFGLRYSSALGGAMRFGVV